MEMFESVKRIYLKGMIDDKALGKAVEIGWITEEEKAEIMASKTPLIEEPEEETREQPEEPTEDPEEENGENA